ncbi:MAG: cation-transporting P-type ATPase, partial [Clostridia bacterium]|nr:cation-transporting P-type ATPase [Clostridia bacterium]
MNEGRFKRESVCNGLNDEQVIESRVRNGSNQFTEKRTRGFFGRLISELGDPIIRILLIALAVTLMIPSGEGGNFDAIGIGVAVALATFVSTLCEYGSEKAFRRMQREAGSRRCCVMRNGKKRELNVGELVVGDIVFLKAGDFVPADGRLISGTLSCDLSALNGESAEQRKIADDDFVGSSFSKVSERGEDLLGDKHSLFRGSELTAGEGVMIVTAVGDHTYYGRMATELQEDVGDSPLKIKLKNLAVTLSKIGYFCAIVVGVSDLAFNTILDPRFIFTFPGVAKSLAHAVTLGVPVVVMAVPEGLPMMITVVLASNMLRMQKAHVMVRKLVGIETAGSINVLFTDKTGTLTYGKPKISGFVYSEGYAERMDGLPKHIYELMTVAATQAVGCDIEYSNGVATAIGGEITDRAFTDAAILCGTARRIGERLAFFPFNSRDKLCAATVKASFGSEERELTLIKGAPEI